MLRCACAPIWNSDAREAAERCTWLESLPEEADGAVAGHGQNAGDQDKEALSGHGFSQRKYESKEFT